MEVSLSENCVRCRRRQSVPSASATRYWWASVVSATVKTFNFILSRSSRTCFRVLIVVVVVLEDALPETLA